MKNQELKNKIVGWINTIRTLTEFLKTEKETDHLCHAWSELEL